ncbi:unnamed protein product [Schistocephalus solidus]|uniref:Metaxin n=1 Tax=Schistocephalus solidus TaxID=70667 RepID=A0A183T3B4_SCHSO|nr:unnamed protein product [Schistocephalus solidus]
MGTGILPQARVRPWTVAHGLLKNSTGAGCREGAVSPKYTFNRAHTFTMDLSIWGGTDEIESYDSDCLVVLNYGLEYNLLDGDSSMLESLVTSIERRITPAVRWFLWADPSVYQSYTSKYYGSFMSWFHGFYILRRWRGSIKRKAENSQITHCTKRQNRPSDVESSLYEGAIRCLTALSYILGSNEFFLANQPTAVDAYLFGRLWPLLNYDLQRNSSKDPPARLIAHIYQCENLFNHCQRIQRMCFPSARLTMRSAPNAQTTAEIETANQTLLSSSSAWLRSRPLRDGFFFGAFVLTVMAMFAVRVGIVRILTEDEDEKDVGAGGDHVEEEPEFLSLADD